MVVETFGGQVMETLGIENMIGTPYTEGPKLMRQVEEHVNEYNVDVMKGQRAKDIRKNEFVEVELENGAVLKTKTAILATGARWRNINVPGEQEFKIKGLLIALTAMVRCLLVKKWQLLVAVILVLKQRLIWQVWRNMSMYWSSCRN